jgi:hypothetical protein
MSVSRSDDRSAAPARTHTAARPWASQRTGAGPSEPRGARSGSTQPPRPLTRLSAGSPSAAAERPPTLAPLRTVPSGAPAGGAPLAAADPPAPAAPLTGGARNWVESVAGHVKLVALGAALGKRTIASNPPRTRRAALPAFRSAARSPAGGTRRAAGLTGRVHGVAAALRGNGAPDTPDRRARYTAYVAAVPTVGRRSATPARRTRRRSGQHPPRARRPQHLRSTSAAPPRHLGRRYPRRRARVSTGTRRRRAPRTRGRRWTLVRRAQDEAHHVSPRPRPERASRSSTGNRRNSL